MQQKLTEAGREAHKQHAGRFTMHKARENKNDNTREHPIVINIIVLYQVVLVCIVLCCVGCWVGLGCAVLC